MLLILVTLVHAVSIVSALDPPQETYHGHKVFRVYPGADTDHKELLNTFTHNDQVDIWRTPRHSNDSYDVKVHPDIEIDNFIQELENLGTDYKIWINDLQELIENERKPSKNIEKRATRYIRHDAYHTYPTILSYMNTVAETATNADVELGELGKSFERRSMVYLKITKRGGSAGKKAIFIDGGIHAREWIAPAVVLYIIDQLAFNPYNDPDVSLMLDYFDWYLLPVVNPDGYQYSITTSRLWRKNRSTYSGRCLCYGSCVGVDLNRNFAFNWDPNLGGSTVPCAETYSGESAFSEPESRNLGRFLCEHGSEIISYISFHAYGQLWMYPWGYTYQLPHDYTDLEEVATNATRALRNVYSSNYIVGSSTNVLYPAAGGTDDYAKGQCGIKYAYTVELRDRGHFAFILPQEQIVPTADETWTALKTLADSIIRKEHLNR
ncbi:hypothetical protein ScPMuIL_001742 [Solemya velum]